MTTIQIQAIKKQAKLSARKANEKMRDLIYIKSSNVPIY